MKENVIKCLEAVMSSQAFIPAEHWTISQEMEEVGRRGRDGVGRTLKME